MMPAFLILAEISDKMPSTQAVITASLATAVLCTVLALLGREAAWTMFAIALSVGVFFAYGGCHEAFLEGSFSEAVWAELGLPWVLASVLGPLLPLCGVVSVLLVRHRRSAQRGVPVIIPSAPDGATH